MDSYNSSLGNPMHPEHVTIEFTIMWKRILASKVESDDDVFKEE